MSTPSLASLGGANAIADVIGNNSRIAIDTEFLREKTYFAQLCLVQIATPETICCLDPLADTGDHGDAWRLLMAVPWVLHSGRQDIEVVYQSSGSMPSEVFDTQVAAALLGYQPQMGYAGLVADLFDVTLDKSHTRADWSVRPLGKQMLNYAAEDVEYLLPAYDILADRLEKLGRLDWAREDSMALLDPDLYAIDDSAAVSRLKGARNLRGTARRAAVRLAVWRERQAIDSNRPRQWILKDGLILEIAARLPGSRKQLAAIDGFPERTLRRAGDHLLAEIAAARADNDDYQPPARPDESQKQLLKRMQKQVAGAAGDLGLSAEILAPRKELSAAVMGERGGRVFRGWRNELIGAELEGMLDASG